MDLRYLSERVGETGWMAGTLYAGTSPKAQEIQVRTFGGVPICPICGMPMERMQRPEREKTADFLMHSYSTRGRRSWR